MVSVYRNVSGTKPIGSYTIEHVLNNIKSDTTYYHSSIIDARNATTETEYKRIKQRTNIPTVTWSGVFYKRALKDLKSLSQYIYFDVDNVDIEEIKGYINEEPFVKASWKSVGGKGFGFLVQFKGLTTSNFKTNYKHISNIFAEKDIELDTLSDYARCNIISYDPDIYINNDNEIIKALPKEEIEEVKVNDFTQEIKKKNLTYKEQCMAVAYAYTVKQKGHYVNGNRHHFTVCYAGICNQFGIDESLAYFFLLEKGCSSKVTFDKIQDIYKRYSHQFCTKKLEKKDEK